MTTRFSIAIVIGMLVPLAIIGYLRNDRIIRIDGQWIAYNCAIVVDDGGFHSNDSAIFLTDVNQPDSTRQLNRTSSPNRVRNPNWLSNNIIAFELGNKIHVWHLDSFDRWKLNPNLRGMESFPVWSPDGKQIAYIKSLSTLYLHNIETSEEIEIIALENPTRPTWSPDGSFIALDQSNKLLVVDVQKRTSSVLLEFDQNLMNGTSWSPNGQYLAFSGKVKGNWGLYRVDVNTLQVDLISEGLTSFPAWSPDGEWIAFNANLNINIIRPDGTDRQRIESPEDCDTVDTLAWSRKMD